MNADLERLGRLFTDGPERFESSPLYRQLGRVTAADEEILAIAAAGEPVSCRQPPVRGRAPPVDPASPVSIESEWVNREPPPDLDRLPTIAERVGLDLGPIDVRDPVERRAAAAGHAERIVPVNGVAAPG